jgi:Tfp pilus assembly protein PilF
MGCDVGILDRFRLSIAGGAADHKEGKCACERFMEQAVALMKEKKLAEALRPLEEAIRLCPTNFKAHGNRGVCLATCGRDREAEASFRLALSFNSDYAMAWENLGVTLAQQRRDEEALPCALRAVDLDPRLPNAPVLAARILIDLKRLDDAIGVLDKHLALNPGSWTARAKRALALHEKGAQVEAEAAYRRAMEADPTDSQTINNYGTLCEEQGRYAEADQLYMMAAASQPGFYQPALANLKRLRSMPR